MRGAFTTSKILEFVIFQEHYPNIAAGRGQILHIPHEERSKDCATMDCGGTTQDEELLKKGKLEMQRTFSNVEDRAHEEILRSERNCQRRRSSTVGSGNAEEEVRKSSTAENPPWGEKQHQTLNLERMTIDQYTGVIVDNLEKIVVFGKVR